MSSPNRVMTLPGAVRAFASCFCLSPRPLVPMVATTRSSRCRELQQRNYRAWTELNPDLLVAIASACESVPALRAFVQTCREWRAAVYSANTNILWEPILRAQYPRALSIWSLLSPPESTPCYKEAYAVQEAVASKPIYKRAAPKCVLSDFTFICELVEETANGERLAVAEHWTGILGGSGEAPTFGEAMALPGKGGSFKVPLDWGCWQRSWPADPSLSPMRLCVSVARTVDGEQRTLLCLRSDTVPDEEVGYNSFVLFWQPLLHPCVFAEDVAPHVLPRMSIVMSRGCNSNDDCDCERSYCSVSLHFELDYYESHCDRMTSDQVCDVASSRVCVIPSDLATRPLLCAYMSQLLRYLDNLPWGGLAEEPSLPDAPNPLLPLPTCLVTDFVVTCELREMEDADGHRRIVQSWSGKLDQPVPTSDDGGEGTTATFLVPLKWSGWKSTWEDDSEAKPMTLCVYLSRYSPCEGIQTVFCFESEPRYKHTPSNYYQTPRHHTHLPTPVLPDHISALRAVCIRLRPEEISEGRVWFPSLPMCCASESFEDEDALTPELGIAMAESTLGLIEICFNMYIPDVQSDLMTSDELTRYLGYCLPW